MKSLRPFLQDLKLRYHHRGNLISDPLWFAHQYKDPHDQEVVALLSALLAYGQVGQIRNSVRSLLALLEAKSPSPAFFVRSLNSDSFYRSAQTALASWVHRFNRGPDILALMKRIAWSWENHGSVGGHLCSYHRSDAPTIQIALTSLLSGWKSQLKGDTGSVAFLLASPVDGSTCKRWCMLLRWMGRRDNLDLGLWTKDGPWSKAHAWKSSVDPSQLVLPLDTHVARIGRYLELTSRRSTDWKTSLEMTESLKQVSPDDPTQYDFSIARLGILAHCRNRYVDRICERCSLLEVCQFAKGRVATPSFSESFV